MKFFGFIIFLLFLTLKCFSQGHFIPAYTGAGQEQMNIIITSAVVLGVNLEPGDEIAAFDGNICCGVLVLDQTIFFGASSTYQVVKASREDFGESNGYIAGHPILYKIWDSSNNQEISGISAIYLDPNTQLPITAPLYNPDSPPVFVKLSASQPNANAGPDQSKDEGLVVTLDGSASSDPDGSLLTYLWTAPPGISLNSNTAQKPTFIAPQVTSNTNYTFSLVVNDGDFSSTVDQIVVTIQNCVSATPSIGTITQPTCSVATGSVVLNSLPASGTWTLTKSPGGTTTTGSGTSTTVSGLTAGTYTFTVTNASGCVSQASASVVINAQPSAPTTPTLGTITQPTCSVATGSVVLNSLPATGTWTLTKSPGGTTSTGSGTSTTVTGLTAGTYTFTVTNASGCVSQASAGVAINAQAATPNAPTLGTITQPTCSVATGSVVLNSLPATGTWTLTKSPGGTTSTGSGTTTTVSGLTAGTYTFTVTNASGCISPASASVVINAQPSAPTAPTLGTITQPTCSVATGSVVLNSLPATGTWTLTKSPGGTTSTGSGTSTTVTGLTAGTYTFTVTNASGCVSQASVGVAINAQAATPAAPVVGTVTQPTCDIATGSVVLNSLPATGTWTLTKSPGGTTTTGSGNTTTVSGLTAGTYTFTVTNASGCVSQASASVAINAQAATPNAPTLGTITQPTCNVATGSVVLNGLPATGTWSLTRSPGGTITTGSGTSTTVTGLTAGTYTFTVTNASGCISQASASVAINAQAATPIAPTLGTITQPTCDIATGSVVLNSLPASGTWTLTKSPGGTTTTGSGITTTVSGLTAGTYTFTVTNASGCISQASASVAINAQAATPIAPTLGTITQPTCDIATGSVVLNSLPASGTWTLTKSPGGTTTTGSGITTTVSGLTAGTYTFTVTNASGCVSQASASVAINAQAATPAAPVVGTVTQPTCDIATGSVVLNSLPATGTWTLTKSPGGTTTTGSGTTTTVSGLTAGTYTFTVTNASGCVSQASASVAINAQAATPAAPVVGTVTQPTCDIATGSVVLNSLPATGTWTLTKSPGGTTTTGSGTTTTVSGLSAGTYTFTVTNASGCVSQASTSVAINAQAATPAAPVVGTVTQPTCDIATGSVVLNSLPATGTWTLTKSPGGTTTTGSGTSSTISLLAAGTYTFTVTNASGCVSQASVGAAINAQAATPVAPVVGTVTQPTCDIATGSVVLNSLPATGTWTLTRSPGGTTTTGSGTTTTVSGLTAGTYTFTVTNASGCVSQASASVAINAQAATPTAPTLGTITQPTCDIATGSVVLNSLPASGTWTLTKSPGGTTTTGSGTSTTISGLTAGTYTFTVTNASGCVSQASASVAINAQAATPNAPTLGTITQPTCDIATGSIVLNSLPATGTWTLTKSPGGTTTTGSGTSTTISGLTAGTYTFTVTNASGCVSQASASVAINAQAATPNAPTLGTITQPTCDIATGSVVLNSLPSSGTWTLTKSPGGTTTTGSGTTTTVSGLTAGTYTFTVTNASGCVSQASASVAINAQAATPNAPTLGTITQPTCSVATGSVVLNGLPATGTWTLTKSPGGTTTTGSGTTTTVSGLTAGTYTFTVTNASGCVSQASTSVAINAQAATPNAPTLGTITQPTCDIATGSVVLNSLPATGTWTLTKSPGGTTSTGSGTTTTVSGLTAGTYTFTVTNASGCVSQASTGVAINAQAATPTAPTLGTITQPTCNVATGSVVLNGLPATGTWTLTKSPGGTTTTGSGTSTTVSGLTAGTYTFTVTNASGCVSQASASVAINVQAATPNAPTLGTITQPTCDIATGSVVLSNLPATGTWTLTKSPGGTITTGSGTSTTVTGLTAGTYTFTVTNASGCVSQASVGAAINAQAATPVAPVVGTVTQPTCDIATGSVVLNSLPATGTWTLTKSPGGTTTTGSGTTTTVSGLTAGTYTFTVTNASGCVSQASASVAINAQAATPTAPTLGTITQPTCDIATGSVVLNGLPASGTWTLTKSPGGTTSTGSGTSTTVSGLTAGTYTFTVTNASGCVSQASASVAINTQPATPSAPTLGTTTQPTCDIATGSVVLNGLPATGTWTLTRSPGGTTTTGTGTSTTISGLTAGTYTFTVTNASGCVSQASASVAINAQAATPNAPTLGTITQTTCSVATGSVVLNGLPATGTWTLTRSPGGTTTTGSGTSTTVSGLTAGTYTFTVTNASGCVSQASASVAINTQPATPSAPTLGTTTQPTCDIATGSVVLNGLPATGTWTLTRSPGGTTTTGTGTSTTISGLTAGTYTFTVTNASGCVSQASASVAINAQAATPTAPVVGTVTQPTCDIATGSVVLNSLPATGTWTLTRSPGGTTTTGSGTSTTISELTAGTYTFTVTNASGCVSQASASVAINAQAATPNAPTLGTITQPTCSVATGSVVLNSLPATGTWTLTRSPGGTTTTGSGTSTTISGLTAGTYTFTVTNASGCVSQASASVAINAQAATPATPVVDSVTQPTSSIPTGSVVLTGLPASGSWTLTRSPGAISTSGTGTNATLSLLPAGTYTFTVTNASGCNSQASANVVINARPIANAGDDQLVNESSLVTLDGSLSSDPDGSPITFKWIAPEGISLNSSLVAQPTFIAPEVAFDTDYLFSLMVNDGSINSITDQVKITVKQINRAPVANAGPDQLVAPNQLVQLNGALSSDLDADLLNYHWTAPEGIVLSGSTIANPEFIAPNVTSDTEYTFRLKVSDGKTESPEDEVIIKVLTYRIPIADAGSDFSADEGSMVTLDGSASSDPKGSTLTYEWIAPSGITLSSNTVQKPGFKAPEVTQDTPYTFTLMVNNGVSKSIADWVTVTIKQVNTPPVANAGNDFSTNELSRVDLNGSLSFDQDNDELSYLWTPPVGISLNFNTVMTPLFFAPNVDSDTPYTFKLTVSDGKTTSQPDYIVVTVRNVNNKPIANAGADQVVDEGTVVSLDGTGSTDANLDALTYLWTAPNGIVLSSVNASKPTFTAPDVLSDQTFVFMLTVNDGKSDSFTDEVRITVMNANKPPVANAGTDQSAVINTIVTLNGSQSFDPENDELTYLWTAPTGINLSSTTLMNPAFFTPQVDSDTEFIFKLTVSDKYHTSQPDYVVITVRGNNKRPVANAGPDKEVNEGTLASLDGSLSSDPDNDKLTFQWTAPEGIVLSSVNSAKPTFTAPEVQTDQTYLFTLTVNDGKADSYTDEIKVTVKQVNKAPYANAGTDQSVNENSVFTLDGSQSFDPENDQITYLWTTPAGIILSSTTSAKPSFTTPDVSVSSKFIFTLTVNDGKLNSAPDQVVVTVRPENQAPVANAGPDQFVLQGSLVTLNGISSNDPNGDAITYRWTAPPGILLSSTTSGKPIFTAPAVSQNTNFTISLIVNDGTLSSPADQVIIHVKRENSAPVYTSANVYKTPINEPFSFTLEGSDIDQDPIQFSIKNLPAFLKLNNTTENKAVLSGTFTSQNLGNNTFILSLSDGTTSTDELITIEVTNGDVAPYVKDSIQNFKVDKGSADKIIDLRSVFADDNPGDELTYAVGFNTDQNIVTGKIVGSYLFLSFSSKNIGIADLGVSVESNGKMAQSKFRVEVQIPTGLDYPVNDCKVSIYPNPAREMVYVKFSQQPKTGTWMTIYNYTGKVISKKLVDRQEEMINLKNLSPGVYLIKIDQSTSKTFQVVVDK